MRIRSSFFSSFVGLFAGLLTAFVVSCAQDNQQQVKPPEPVKKYNDSRQINKPYVVMISIDGYRHDYTQKYNPPNISALAQNGVQAEGLIPSYPSLTFPNHFTLVTGLVPEHHGIVGNGFFDRQRNESYSMSNGKTVNDGTWYSGIPLWRAASMSGLLSATMYWVGSEAEISGGKADYIRPWTPQIDHKARVDQVIEWLSLPEDQRPHFVTLYFSEVDSKGHTNSPDSDEVKAAILDIDQQIGRLRDFARTSTPQVNIVIVSDHGMRTLTADKFLPFHEYLDLSKFKVEERGAIVHLYTQDNELINRTLDQITRFPHMNAYRRANVPAKYRFSNNQRIGDIVVIPEVSYYLRTAPKLNIQEGTAPTATGGTHGWDTADLDMHGIFYAEGPQFKQQLKIARFQNIHIYPMMLNLLGLPAYKSDGDPNVLRGILSK